MGRALFFAWALPRGADMSEHPRGRLAGWILLALAGLALAVVLSVTASNLSTQPIGLSGEPLRAGDRLAPPQGTRFTTTPAPARTHTKPTPPQTTTAPVPSSNSGSGNGDNDGDDHGGRRHPDSDD
jgi:hypothetical protein